MVTALGLFHHAVLLFLASSAQGYLSVKVGSRNIPKYLKAASRSSDRPDVGPLWHLPNCFETFLNQCSVQSFLFLARQLRDPQTILWVENFTQPALKARKGPSYSEHMRSGSQGSRLLTYHGLAAMNMTLFETWDAYFRKLLFHQSR